MPPTSVTTTPPGEAARVLAAAAEAVDGVGPLNEQALFDVDNAEVQHIGVVEAGELVGYAQIAHHEAVAGNPGPGRTVQLVVHPDHRRQGIGGSLAKHVRGVAPDAGWWAFGLLPAAAALAETLDLVPARSLHILVRDLETHPPQVGPLPAGVSVRAYTPADEAAWLAVNAAAFAHHPEQGSITSADLAERTQAEWFDPAGFLLAFDDDGTLLGFHWTKQHDQTTGEVYVIGVGAAAEGRGLGRVLLERGLDHLRSRGCRRVMLYVDGDNERARRMYAAAGFAETRRDVCFEPRRTSR